jgi:hypothetical protein
MKAPCICKLRKNCHSGIYQCAMVLSKHFNFFILIGAFMIVNCGMKKNIFQVRNEFHRLHLNWLPNRKEGGWADFLKTFRASLFNDDLSYEPNFPGQYL